MYKYSAYSTSTKQSKISFTLAFLMYFKPLFKNPLRYLSAHFKASQYTYSKISISRLARLAYAKFALLL